MTPPSARNRSPCAATVEAFGASTCWCTPRAGSPERAVPEVTDEEWATVFDVQLTGAYRATRTSAREMETGSIPHVASASAGTAIPDPAVYSAAEGLDAFVRVAADELASEIRVDAVRPGFVRSERTERTPRFEAIRERTTGGRLTRPEEVVGAAVSLASDAASYATGEIATVDGGFVAATFEE